MSKKYPIRQKKRKCLISSYPTDPNILGSTKSFFEAFWDILKSIFKGFFRLFPYKKVFIKKKVCLPTGPKIFGDITDIKDIFFFWKCLQVRARIPRL